MTQETVLPFSLPSAETVIINITIVKRPIYNEKGGGVARQAPLGHTIA